VVGKWVVSTAFKRIIVMETIKTADEGYVWLYGCRPKSVFSGLCCGPHWTPALPVTHSALRRHMRQLWCYINELYFYLFTFGQIAWSKLKQYIAEDDGVRELRCENLSRTATATGSQCSWLICSGLKPPRPTELHLSYSSTESEEVSK